MKINITYIFMSQLAYYRNSGRQWKCHYVGQRKDKSKVFSGKAASAAAVNVCPEPTEDSLELAR